MGKRKEPPTEEISDVDQGTPIAQQPESPPAKRQFVALHKARFLDWTPTAAVACAATDDGLLMAVARESGKIELWETENWSMIKVCLSTTLMLTILMSAVAI